MQNDDLTNGQTQEEGVLKEMPESRPKNWKLISSVSLFIVVAILLGSFSAFLFWQNRLHSSATSQANSLGANQQKPPEPKQDTKTFRDKAEGVIEKSEDRDQYAQGTHKLIREGGPSQTAYLVSSVVDLDKYVGKKVVVMGETFQSEQVGWLMDVGRVEVKD